MNSENTVSERARVIDIRRGIGLLAFSFPFVMVGTYSMMEAETLTLLNSLSAHYHTEVGLLFTGLLVAIAVGLISYRGYDKERGECFSEDFWGTVAGFAALGTGIFPPDALPGKTAEAPILVGIHFVSAVTMFALVIVFVYRFSKPWNSQAVGLKKWFPEKWTGKVWYIVAAAIMAILSVIAAGSAAAVSEGPPPSVNIGAMAIPIVILSQSITMILFGLAWWAKGRRRRYE